MYRPHLRPCPRPRHHPRPRTRTRPRTTQSLTLIQTPNPIR